MFRFGIIFSFEEVLVGVGVCVLVEWGRGGGVSICVGVMVD